MNLLQSRFLVIVTAILLCQCSERDPVVSEGESAASTEDPVVLDGEAQAVESGRVEILTVERHLLHRTRVGTRRIQRSVTLPQLVGEGTGVERINGFLRHLALHWPTLPQTGRTSAEEAAGLMREIGEKASALRREDWPTKKQIELLEGLLPVEYFGQEEHFSSHDEADFRIGIVRLADEQIVLHLEVFDASGATTRGNEGELTLDLRSGNAIHPR